MAAYPKFRQAVGVFYDPDRLEDALNSLAKAGIDGENVGLLAGQETIDSKVRPHLSKTDNPILGDLLQTMIVLGPVSEAGPLFVSRGRLADFLNRTSGDESAAKSFPDGHLPDRHAAFLREHLDAGACLLWVTIHDGDREKAAGTALLRHSQHQVQMHDLSD